MPEPKDAVIGILGASVALAGYGAVGETNEGFQLTEREPDRNRAAKGDRDFSPVSTGSESCTSGSEFGKLSHINRVRSQTHERSGALRYKWNDNVNFLRLSAEKPHQLVCWIGVAARRVDQDFQRPDILEPLTIYEKRVDFRPTDMRWWIRMDNAKDSGFALFLKVRNGL
jgi:hypothetical protein